MKTIKQIADELGVSKQAVHQKRKKEPLSTDLQPFTQTVDGVVYISVNGENLIKQAFFKASSTTPVDGVSANGFTPVDSQVSSEFTTVVEVLRTQLEIKDKQIAEQQQSIKELTAALEHTTGSLNAAQALHAGTMQKSLEDKASASDEDLLAPKQSIWQKIFNRK